MSVTTSRSSTKPGLTPVPTTETPFALASASISAASSGLWASTSDSSSAIETQLIPASRIVRSSGSWSCAQDVVAMRDDVDLRLVQDRLGLVGDGDAELPADVEHVTEVPSDELRPMGHGAHELEARLLEDEPGHAGAHRAKAPLDDTNRLASFRLSSHGGISVATLQNVQPVGPQGQRSSPAPAVE